jgi:hypothetical protein
LRLDIVDAIIPATMRMRALEWILGKNLHGPADIPDEPSGGLLVIATKL